MSCRCVLARFHLVGVLPSASRPCRTHFFVAPRPATPNNKKRLPFGNLLLLLERAMGLALPLRPRSVSPRRRTSVRLSSLSDPRHQPWQPKKSSQRWLLLAFYHVNFTDIGMFSHIVDIINFGIGFSIF